MDDSPRPPVDPAASPAAKPWDIGGAHEDALRELLRSPLDEEPRRARGASRPGRKTAVLLFLAAAAAGAGLTVAGASLVGGEAAPATTTSATTTSAATPSGPALPAGYYPLGEGFGARVERILQRPDAVFVTLSLAVDDEHDPAATTGHQGGQWLLEFPDGTSVRSSGVAFDPVARAAATIAFPPSTTTWTEPPCAWWPSRTSTRRPFSATVAGTVAALPTEGTLRLALEPAGFALDGGGTLRVGPLDLGPTSAGLEWTVEGTGVAGFVDPELAIDGPGAIFSLIRNDPFSSYIGTGCCRSRRPLSPPPAGRPHLPRSHPPRPGPRLHRDGHLLVTWSTSTPADATLPLDGAQIVIVGAIG